MSRLIWSPRALRDVARLHAFLKSKNHEAAARAVRAIRKGIPVLASHPEIGRPIEEMEPEFRDWLIEFGDERSGLLKPPPPSDKNKGGLGLAPGGFGRQPIADRRDTLPALPLNSRPC